MVPSSAGALSMSLAGHRARGAGLTVEIDPQLEIRTWRCTPGAGAARWRQPGVGHCGARIHLVPDVDRGAERHGAELSALWQEGRARHDRRAGGAVAASFQHWPGRCEPRQRNPGGSLTSGQSALCILLLTLLPAVHAAGADANEPLPPELTVLETVPANHQLGRSIDIERIPQDAGAGATIHLTDIRQL
jgi:hypothetical protein